MKVWHFFSALIVTLAFAAGAQAEQDLLSGQIEFMYTTLAATLPHIRSGKLKALAMVGSQRSQVLPGVPTLSEAGYSGTEGEAWAGLSAPGGTPRAVVEKIHADVAAVPQQAELRERLTSLGLNVVGNKPDEFAAVIKADTAKWAAVIRANNIKAD